MFDQTVLLINHYFIWIALLIGLFKVVHIVWYKGLQPAYIASTYFRLYSGLQLSYSKTYVHRFRFRLIHNVLTVAFYSFVLFWGIIRLVLAKTL